MLNSKPENSPQTLLTGGRLDYFYVAARDDDLAFSLLGHFQTCLYGTPLVNTIDLVKQLVAVFCIAFNIDQMCSIIKPDHALKKVISKYFSDFRLVIIS